MDEYTTTRETLIQDLDIPERLRLCLLREWGYVRGKSSSPTVGDFIDTPDHQLLRFTGFGHKTLNAWKEVVRRVENPYDPKVEEELAEYKALKEICVRINQIAAMHKSIATHYNKLAEVIAPHTLGANT